ISSSVVLGYITGAGILIAVGQLHNITGTTVPAAKLWVTLPYWFEHLGETRTLPLVVALGTIAAILTLRRLNRMFRRRLPPSIVVMVLSIVVSLAFDLEAHGLRVIADLSPIPNSLPPFTVPDFDAVLSLLS